MIHFFKNTIRLTTQSRQFFTCFKLHSISLVAGQRCPGLDFASTLVSAVGENLSTINAPPPLALATPHRVSRFPMTGAFAPRCKRRSNMSIRRRQFPLHQPPLPTATRCQSLIVGDDDDGGALRCGRFQHQLEQAIGGAAAGLPVGSSASAQPGCVTRARAMATGIDAESIKAWRRCPKR